MTIEPWHRKLDLSVTTEDEVCALIDDVIDNEAIYDIYDTRESEKPRAVMMPWSLFVKLTGGTE